MRSRGPWMLVALVVLVLAACGDSDSGDSSESEKGFTLGFAYGLENTPIYQNVLPPAQAAARKLDVTLQTGSADGKCDRQLRDMRNMVQSGVKAITFLGLCGKGDAYNQVVNQAKGSGIAVVSYAFPHPLADGSILFADEQGAQDFARHATAWIRESFDPPYEDFSYATLPCSFAPPPIQLRMKIPTQAITKLTGKKPYSSIDCANTPDTGKSATDTYLRKDPGLDMVLGIDDAGSLGAYLSFKANGKSGQSSYIGGMDGTRESLELIAEDGKDGIYKFSGALPMSEIGEAVVRMPYNIVNKRGPSDSIINYTPITTASAASRWIQQQFVRFEDGA